MVEGATKNVSPVRNSRFEDSGDVITLKDGKVEDFHVISPGTDSESLRIVGALGEMLYEQVKKSFGIDSLFVVAQHENFRLVMFPRKAGFAVWKTNLDLPRIVSALHENDLGRQECSAGDPDVKGTAQQRRGEGRVF